MGKGKGKLNNVVKQLKAEQGAAIKQKRLQKEREQAQRNKVAKQHKLAMERAKCPFTDSQRILLVGEGNFSFARALTEVFFKSEFEQKSQKYQSIRRDVDASGATVAENGSTDSLTSSLITSAAACSVSEVKRKEVDEVDDVDEMDNADENDSESSGEEDADISSSAIATSTLIDGADEETLLSIEQLRERCYAHCGRNLVATCLDSSEILAQKYPDAPEIVTKLVARQAKVMYEVDAMQLHCNVALASPRKFDRVVFVFPHTGCGIKDRARNIADQKRLLMGFFLSAAQMLAKQGEIHLTVKRGEPYDSWGVVGLARDCHTLILDRAYEFYPHVFPGYAHRRTLGFEEHISDADNGDIAVGATTYVFRARPSPGDLQAAKKQKRREQKQAAKAKDRETGDE